LTDRFRKIDDHNRSDHYHLDAADECYFLYEYTSGQNYQYSSTNSLISNLKKKPSLKGMAQYRYKLRAIEQCAKLLGSGINAQWLNGATLIAVPPSKERSDPEYDDRILQICRAIPAAGFNVDVRETVRATKSLPAAHEGHRPTVDDLLAVYAIDEAQAQPTPRRIGVVDDVLTAGTHFCAMKRILNGRVPRVPIVGFFVARRILPNPFEDFDDAV
jgi:predicted amidophosphoribosyltransferase